MKVNLQRLSTVSKGDLARKVRELTDVLQTQEIALACMVHIIRSLTKDVRPVIIPSEMFSDVHSRYVIQKGHDPATDAIAFQLVPRQSEAQPSKLLGPDGRPADGTPHLVVAHQVVKEPA